MTPEIYLRAAYQAILEGDYATRDRLVALAEKAQNSTYADRVARLMEVDFFVTPAGVAIPITAMMNKA